MEKVEEITRPLNVPKTERAHYKTNLIQQVVCELRFPTLFDFDAVKPPVAFASMLRKEYPNYSKGKNVSVGANDIAQATVHQFRTKRSNWSVTLRASAISIETTNYDSFEDFAERISLVLKAAEKVIDSDFFTRIGLRYINAVPYKQEEIAQWVNPDLVGVLAAGSYGDVAEYSQRVAGTIEGGGYLFQQGVGFNPNNGRQEYALDFDFYCEDVEVGKAMEVVKKLHDHEFAMFSWAIGPKAREHMGPSDKKR